MIEFRKTVGQRILDVGCGERRHPAADVAVDCRPCAGVDFVHDLAETPWPLRDGEFDAVLASYVLEHLPYHRTAAFLTECLRVLKPGGRLVLLVPHTEAQLEWAKKNPGGWDDKDFFASASELLFGTQRPGEDAAPHCHKAYFSPAALTGLLRAAGFGKVITEAAGERSTDLTAVADKPAGSALFLGSEGKMVESEDVTDVGGPRAPSGYDPEQLRRVEEESAPDLPTEAPGMFFVQRVGGKVVIDADLEAVKRQVAVLQGKS